MSQEGVEQPEDCWLLRLMPAELLHEILRALLAAGEKDSQQQLRDVAAWCLTCSAFNDVCDDETRCRLRCLAAYPGLFSLALSPLFGAPNTHYVASSPASSSTSSSFPSATSSTSSVLSSSTSMPCSSQRRGAAKDYCVDVRPPRLTWRQRVALLPHLPQRVALCASEREAAQAAQAAQAVVGGGLLKRIFRKEEDSCSAEHDEIVFTVDAKTGRHHINSTGQHNNLLADHPFLSTNEAALLRVFDGDGPGDAASGGGDSSEAAGGGDELAQRARQRRALFVDSLLYRGVEYFEMTVLNNQVSWNRAVAIAIAQHFDSMSFLGWTSTTIAYHSDDGTIRGGDEDEVYRSKVFSTGAVVGCGIDWDAGDLFFVCLAPNEPVEVHLYRPRLDRLPWYPAISSMSRGDEVKVNFGQEPFVFDLETFVRQKRGWW